MFKIIALFLRKNSTTILAVIGILATVALSDKFPIPQFTWPSSIVLDFLHYIKDIAPVIFVIGLWWWERRRRERIESQLRATRIQDRIYFLNLVVAVYGQFGEQIGVKDENIATLIKAANKEKERLQKERLQKELDSEERSSRR